MYYIIISCSLSQNSNLTDQPFYYWDWVDQRVGVLSIDDIEARNMVLLAKIVVG